MKLTLDLGTRLRMSGAVPLLPLYAFILCTDAVFTSVTSFFLCVYNDRPESESQVFFDFLSISALIVMYVTSAYNFHVQENKNFNFLTSVFR